MNLIDLQKNKESNLICNNCNKIKNDIHKNKLYKYCTCKINICLICKSKHNEGHILIENELKNYICNIHGEKYILYCEECNKYICDLYEIDHNNHNYYSLNKLITNKENNINELRTKIDNLKKELNDMINKFNKIMDNLEIYYNISNAILQSIFFLKNLNSDNYCFN